MHIYTHTHHARTTEKLKERKKEGESRKGLWGCPAHGVRHTPAAATLLTCSAPPPASHRGPAPPHSPTSPRNKEETFLNPVQCQKKLTNLNVQIQP